MALDGNHVPNAGDHVGDHNLIDQALAARNVALTPVAVKTSAYTAGRNEFVPVDTTSGSVTVTLPSAPPDATRVSVKHVIQGGANSVSISRSGSDVFNKAGGSTAISLPLLDQTAILQYKASTGIWYVQSGNLPLPALDTRYVTLAGTDPAIVPVPKPQGDARAGVWEYVHNGAAGYLYHLMCGVDMASGAALIGMGIDNDGIGLFVNNKKAGTGIKIDQNNTITDATAYGLEVNQSSSVAPAIQVQQSATGTHAIQLVASAAASANQKFLKLIAGASPDVKGEIDSLTGRIYWKADIVTHDGGLIRATGNAVSAQDSQTKLEKNSVIMSSFTGSTDQYWHKRIRHGGQSLYIEVADTLAGGVDATPGTWYKAIEAKQTSNTAGGTQLGFYGATPVAKPTGVAVTAEGIHAALVSLGLIAA